MNTAPQTAASPQSAAGGLTTDSPTEPSTNVPIPPPVEAEVISSPVPAEVPLVRDVPLKEGDFRIDDFRFYIVCGMLISEAIASSMLYSYVGLFVARIEPRLTRSTAGYIAGFLVGCFQATQVISLPLWGRLSDKLGRKPVMITASALSVLASVLFGFATSFPLAMCARAFHGLVAGGMAIGKTYIYEVTDQHSQARGFGLMNLMWAVGSFIGPSVGGFLYDINESPIFSTFLPRIALFDEHPALPPALAMATYAAFALTLVHLFVPESHPKPVAVPVLLADIRAWVHAKLGMRAYRRLGDATASPAEQEGDTVVEEEENDDAPILSTPARPEGVEPAPERGTASVGDAPANNAVSQEDAPPEKPEGEEVQAPSTQPEDEYSEFHKRVDAENERLNALPTVTVRQIFAHPLLRLSIPMYMMLCGFNIAYNEVFPLYAVAYREDGGLGFTSTQMGFAGMINSVVSVCANGMFERVSKRMPMMTMWARCCTGTSIALFLVGFFSYLPSPTACLIAFFPLCVLRTSCTTWAFGLNMMFTANAAPKKHLGVVTTTTMASASVARSIAPMLAAPIFAWSVSGSHLFPFNHFLLFIICAFMALGCVFIGRRMPQEVIIVRRK